MGTISEKLVYLNGTKQAIKQAINEDFEVIDDNTTFREYADEISSNNAKYKDLIPKETTNATNTLDISNSAGLDKALVTQYGNTYQETTTGKNKLPYPYTQTSITSNGVTYTAQSDGGVLVNGTSTGTATIKLYGDYQQINNLDVPGKYLTGGTNNVILRAYNHTGNSYTPLANDNGNGAEIDTSTYSKCYIELYVEAGTTVNNERIYPMVVDSLSDRTYEKYTGGNPAPNPDYPQTITNVTGTSTITIANSDSSQSQNYTINLGDIELCKIGDYQDRIYPLNGKWYLEKNINQKTIGNVLVFGVNGYRSGTDIASLNGTYSITKNTLDSNIANYNMYFTIAKYEYSSTITDNMNAQTNLNDNTMCMRQGTNDRIYFKNSSFTEKTGAQISSEISNEKLYYRLATPTTEEITDSNYPTLYNQLNNIKLFEGVNHITMTNESGLDVEFDIEYYKDWKLD